MRQALSVRLNSHCWQLPPPARDTSLHQPGGRDAGRGAGPYRQEWLVGRDANPHYTFLREERFHSQTETSACLPVSHFLQTNRILQDLFLDLQRKKKPVLHLTEGRIVWLFAEANTCGPVNSAGPKVLIMHSCLR